MTSNSAIYRDMPDARRRLSAQYGELFGHSTPEGDTRQTVDTPPRRPGRLLSLIIHILGPF
jgi:hypothetical protein